MYSGCIEDKGHNKEPGEGGAVSNAGRGEPSTRKAKEIRKVESSRIMVWTSCREGGENP